MPEKYPCYIYCAGRDFCLEGDLAVPRLDLSELALLNAQGQPCPHPDVFYPVENAAEARFFLFPYDLGPFADFGLLPQLSAQLAALPHLAGRESSHLATDYADNCARTDVPITLFKVSLLRCQPPGQNGHSLPLWYRLPAHSLAARPGFDWAQIRYDISFVGKQTSPLRRAALAALRAQAGPGTGLRLFMDIDENFQSGPNFFHSPPADPNDQQRRQQIFLNSLERARCVFCPPGVGPQSIRMYEAMRLGRIPVVFETGAVLPQEDLVNYADFCLIIPQAEVMNCGNILRAWLAEQNEEQLNRRCALAARTWQRHFAANKLQTLLQTAIQRFGI